MASFKSFLGISREDGTEVSQTVDIPVEISLKVGDDVEDNKEEAGEQVDEVVVAQEAEELVAEVTEASDQVEEVADVIEETSGDIKDQEELVESNPEAITESTVAIAAQSFAFNAKRLGISMESFIPQHVLSHESVSSSPVSAFRVVHEAEKSFLDKVKDWFKKLWENIKKICAKLWDSFKSLFISTEKRAKYIKENKSKLDKLTGVDVSKDKNAGTYKSVVGCIPSLFKQGATGFVQVVNAAEKSVKNTKNSAMEYNKLADSGFKPDDLNYIKKEIESYKSQSDAEKAEKLDAKDIISIGKSKASIYAKTDDKKLTVVTVAYEVKDDDRKLKFNTEKGNLVSCADAIVNLFDTTNNIVKSKIIEKLVDATSKTMQRGVDKASDANKESLKESMNLVSNFSNIAFVKVPALQAKNAIELVNGMFKMVKIAENYEAPKEDK